MYDARKEANKMSRGLSMSDLEVSIKKIERKIEFKEKEWNRLCCIRDELKHLLKRRPMQEQLHKQRELLKGLPVGAQLKFVGNIKGAKGQFRHAIEGTITLIKVNRAYVEVDANGEKWLFRIMSVAPVSEINSRAMGIEENV